MISNKVFASFTFFFQFYDLAKVEIIHKNIKPILVKTSYIYIFKLSTFYIVVYVLEF